MKKTLLSIVVLVFLGLAAYSQSIVLKDESGNVITNLTMTVSGTDTIISHITVLNSSASAQDYKVKKSYINVISGTENVFCWDKCYPPSTMSSNVPVTIGAGQTSTAFVGDYYSKGNVGSSTIRYMFINNVDRNDTAFVDVIYTSIVGYDKNMPEFTLSNPYPNPANENVSFKYLINRSFYKSSVKIFDLLGNIVLEKEINGAEGIISLNTSDLMNGIYFYSIVIDEKPYISRRMVVKH